MEADWSVELAADDPALEMPWASDDGALRWVSLREHPEQITELSECRAYPELGGVLHALNAADGPFLTAKCDVFAPEPAEEADAIFGTWRQTGYIDLLFVDCLKASSALSRNFSFNAHEQFARIFASHAEDVDQEASVELIVRRCYYRKSFLAVREEKSGTQSAVSPRPPELPRASAMDLSAEVIVSGHAAIAGFYFTLYVTGYGESADEARRQWGRALAASADLLLQVGAPGQASGDKRISGNRPNLG